MQLLGVSQRLLESPDRAAAASSGSATPESDSGLASDGAHYSPSFPHFAAGEPIGTPILRPGVSSADLEELLHSRGIGRPDFNFAAMPVFDSAAPNSGQPASQPQDNSISTSPSLGALGYPVGVNNSFRHEALPPEVFEDEPLSPSTFPFLSGLGSSASIAAKDGTRALSRVASGIRPLSRTQSGVAALRRAPSNLTDARMMLAEAGIASAEQDLADVDGVDGLQHDSPLFKKLKADVEADESTRSGLSCRLFKRLRPALGMLLLVLCCLGIGSMISTWLPIPLAYRQRPSVELSHVVALKHKEPRDDLVIVFRSDAILIEDLHLLCGQTHAGDVRPVVPHKIARYCDLSRACTDVFGSTIMGIAGSFTQKELQLLHSCLPGAVDYMEADHAVRVGVSSRTLSTPAAEKNATSIDKRLAKTPAIRRNKIIGGPDLRIEAPPAPPAAPGGEELNRDPAPDLGALPGPFMQTLGTAQWNLDRISKRDLPLNHEFLYGSAKVAGSGRGVNIYVLDSGIDLSLSEFVDPLSGQSRATSGWNVFDNTASAQDCLGHGTALASISAGQIFGVAKAANIVAVKVLDCSGHGSIKQSISGLDWVSGHVKKPAVIVLSLGVLDNDLSRSLDQAVEGLIAQGVTVVVAAGNSRISACGVAPADVDSAITVGGTNLAAKFESSTSSTDTDSLYKWTNTGPCIDICAPAVDIPSACMVSSGDEHGFDCDMMGNTSFTKTTGTSFAAPQVAGAAAMWLGEYPEATPAEVRAAILGAATSSKLSDSVWPLNGTPDMMLYTNLWDGRAENSMSVSSSLLSDSAAADAAVAPTAQASGDHHPNATAINASGKINSSAAGP